MYKKMTLALFSLLAANSVFATEQTGIFVRPALGYYFPASKRSLDNAGTPSLTIGYGFNQCWRIGLGAALINTQQKETDDHVHGFLYTLDAIYHIQKNYYGFSPYVMAGPIFTSLKPTTNSDPVNQGGASAGIGVGYYFTPGIGVSVEARDLYTFAGGKNDLLLTAGLTFWLTA